MIFSNMNSKLTAKITIPIIIMNSNANKTIDNRARLPDINEYGSSIYTPTPIHVRINPDINRVQGLFSSSACSILSTTS
jgi:hypothetical protein